MQQRSTTVQPGDKVFVMVFQGKWFDECRQGPFEVLRCSGTAVQLKGSPTWYHLSHCVKAQSEGTSRAQANPLTDSVEDNAEVHNNTEGVHQVESVGNAFVFPSVVVGNDTSGQQQGQTFDVVDFRHLPNAEPSRPATRSTTRSAQNESDRAGCGQSYTRPATRSTTGSTSRRE